MEKKSLLYLLLLVGFLVGCSEDEIPVVQETPLVAEAGNDQTVAPLTEVTLDGSASTGPEGFNYEWIYSGSETISLSSINSATTTFIPEKTGIYQFTLRITKNGEFSEDFVSITVSGAVEITSSSFESGSLQLVNLNDDPTVADYLISSDFTIPSGSTLSISNGESVTIAVADGAGIIINGSFTSSDYLYFIAENSSWKGILVDGGSFNSTNQLNLDNAGGGTFSGQNDAAAITVVNDGSLSISGSMTMTNTQSDIGINFSTTASYSQTLSGGITDVKIPIKAPIDFVNYFNQMYFDVYDYIQLTTPGAGTTVALSSGEFTFTNNYKYYIDNDFTAGSQITMSGATVYMAAGTGIVSSTHSVFSSVSIQGLDGADWKGIASTSSMVINSAKIIGGGSATHSTGSFSTTDLASIHISSSSQVTIQNSEITDSNGHGVYFGINSTNADITSNTFSGSSLYDISMPFASASIIKTGNTWSMNSPVELRSSSSGSNFAIPELGNGASYDVTSNYVHGSGTVTIQPGASLRFASNTGLINPNGLIIALGTSEKPIIFDGIGGTSGSWNGIELNGAYRFEYCEIKNGGQNAYVGAEKANVVFGYLTDGASSPQSNAKFDNNTVSGSAGAGTFVKLGKFNPLIDNSTNTFQNNVSQDSDGDGIPDDGEFGGCEYNPGC